MSESTENYTAQNWDELRTSFATSIMVDTALTSLAQNLEGPDWPIKGKEECPSVYIDLTLDEVKELLVMKGYPDKVGLLISILEDTLSFDDPFGDMLENTEKSAEKDNQLIKNMAKLEIPEDFPITLTALDSDTREFCNLEKLTTIGEFARFAQNMSQNVIVGGDFRKLLNALSHVDVQGLREVLPFRVGDTGLHLFECLAQAKGDVVRGQAALEYYSDEWKRVQESINEGTPLSRQLIVLGNEKDEAQVAEIIGSLTNVKTTHSASGKKGGLFGALLRLFGK